MIASIGLFVLGLSGCEIFAEFEGTWVYSTGGQTLSMTFSKTTSDWIYSGIQNGTMSFSVVAYDESADHIQLSVTGATGDMAGTPLGMQVYILYSISGNLMTIGADPSAYPAAVNTGPFVKQ